MKGTLFQLFDVGASAYFVFLLVGFLFATAAGTAWARRIGQDPDVIVDLGLASLLLGIIGGKLLHVLADGYLQDYVNLCVDPTLVDYKLDRAQCVNPESGGLFAPPARAWDATRGICHPTESDCFAWLKFWNPGYAYYGGLIVASIGAWFLLKRDKFPFWKAADMAGFAIPIGLGFGRMGCLLAGCCFGSPHDGSWALSFPGRSPASVAQAKAGLLASARLPSLPVHATQIYESIGSLLVAAICLFVVHGRKRYDGQVFLAFLGLYAALRFGLEFLRADDRGALLGLSTSQLIGLGLVALAVGIHARRRPGPPSTPTNPPEEPRDEAEPDDADGSPDRAPA
jgi:phosphatidylglycerol---prolipoprotein diacylglyceryl transferase